MKNLVIALAILSAVYPSTALSINTYYDHGSFPATGAALSSAAMRAELDLIEAGFDKLPTLTANGSKAVVVNSGGTALTVTTGTLTLPGNFALSGSSAVTLTSTGTTNVTLPTTGTLSTLAGSETFTNKTLTSPTISSPVLSGTVTGTYTLGGTPTISSPAINGTVTTSGLTLPAFAAGGTISGATGITSVGTIATGVWNGTAVGPTFGGTGLTTYALGDTLYSSASNTLAALSGSTVATTKAYFQRGTGAVSAAPAWLPTTGDLHNIGLASSVASNIWTIALKGENGNDPSTTNPASAKIRSATLTTGNPVWMTRVSALSLAVPDTALLGTTSGVPYRIWILASTTDGTTWDVLCVFNTQGTSQLHPLPSESALHSATAIGTGSDSAGVLYCGSATTSMPVKWIGYAEIQEATAGTWATEETVIQVMGPGVRRSGEVVQTAVSADGAVATGTTVIPNDDTIPQITEGDQYLAQAITPTNTINILEIGAIVFGSGSLGTQDIVAMFQDSTADALKATGARSEGGGALVTIPLFHRMRAATTSATTFRIRAGVANAGTFTFNGTAGTRAFAGTAQSYVRVQEIFP